MKIQAEIVPMTDNLAAAAASLEAQCFSAPWSRNMIAESAARDDMVFLCALVGGEYAGHASMRCVLDEGQICNVAVSSSFRRMGVGSMLLDALKREALLRGLTVLMLEVRVSNTAAQALYEKNGFLRVGMRRSFYSCPREDAFLYNFDLC